MLKILFMLTFVLTVTNTQLNSQFALHSDYDYNDSEAPLRLEEEKREQEDEQKKLASQKRDFEARAAQEQEDEPITDIRKLFGEEEQETITTLEKESREAKQQETTGKISITTTKAPSQAQQSLVRSVLSTVINFLRSLWSGFGGASATSTSVLLELSKQASTLDALQKQLGSTQEIKLNLPTLRSALTGIRQFITSFNQTQKTVQILGKEKPAAAFTFTVRNIDNAHDFLQNQIKAFKVVLGTLIDYPEILDEQASFVQAQLSRLRSSLAQESTLRNSTGSANLYESFQNGLVSASLRQHLDKAVVEGSFPESKTTTNAERAYEVFGLPNFATVDEVQAKWEEMRKKYSDNPTNPVFLAGREAVSIVGDPMGKSLYDSFLLAKNSPILQEQFNNLALSPSSIEQLQIKFGINSQVEAMLASGIKKDSQEEAEVKELIQKL